MGREVIVGRAEVDVEVPDGTTTPARLKTAILRTPPHA
jgi:hypothetical protein